MDKIKATKFEMVTAAFDTGFQQDILSYIITIENQGFTYDDIKDYHKYKIQERKGFVQRELNRLKEGGEAIKCSESECNGVMLLVSVNTEPGNQTGDDSKSVWMCQNTECMHTIYNKETVQEIIKSGGT